MKDLLNIYLEHPRIIRVKDKQLSIEIIKLFSIRVLKAELNEKNIFTELKE